MGKSSIRIGSFEIDDAQLSSPEAKGVTKCTYLVNPIPIYVCS